MRTEPAALSTPTPTPPAPAAGGLWWTSGSGRLASLAVILAVAVAFPFVFSNPATTSVAIFTLLFVGASSAWNTFSGYTGYMALGNAAFYGSGAYVMANLATHLGMRGGVAVFALVPLAGIGTGIIAIPVGWLALRTRRHTFVVITIAVFFIFQLLAYNLRSVTDGSAGMPLPLPPWLAVEYNDYFYMAALIVAIIAVATAWAVRRSSFGLKLLAIRDDEDRALGLGVRTGRVKMTAFVLTGVLTGMAGAVYAYYIGSIYPPYAFDALFDVTVALMAFLGGLGTISGPVVGALILEPVQQYLNTQLTDAGLALIVFGALFLVVIGFLPEGIVPALGRLLRVFQIWRLRAAAPTEPVPAEADGSPAAARSGVAE